MANSKNSPDSDLTFPKEEDAEQYIASRFKDLSPNTTETAQIVRALELITKTPYQPPLPPSGAPVLVPRFRWVIKNDDLALMDNILDGVRASAAAGFFWAATSTQASKWAAIAGLVASVYKMARNAIRKGGVLQPDTYTVLATIKGLKPISEDHLLAKLASANEKWNEAALRAILASLEAFPMTNGDPKRLISKDTEGRWSDVGL